MDHKGRLRRLNQLYADIDLPALNPAGQAIEARQASESLSSSLEGESAEVIVLPQIESFEMAAPYGEEEALPLLADPLTDVIVFPQTEQVEAAESEETVETVDVAALPLLADPMPDPVAQLQTEQIEIKEPVPSLEELAVDALSLLAEPVSNANPVLHSEQNDIAELAPATEALDVATLPLAVEPVPTPAVPQLPVEKQVVKSGLQSPKANGTRQADWKAILIGVVTGTLVSGIIILITLVMNFFNTPGRLILWGGEMFLGIVGALLANAWKTTPRELWRAALTWTLYPVWFALLIGLILLLLTFTSLTG